MKPQSFSEPRPHWLPLKMALLIVAAPDQAARHERLDQEIGALAKGEIHNSGEDPLSRGDLRAILREKSEAKNVTVNAVESTFLYEYADGFSIEHKPWHIASSEPAPFSLLASDFLWREVMSGERALDDQLSTMITQHEAREKREMTAVRREAQASRATNFVWVKLLLPGFHKAVAEKRAVLWARRSSLSAEFGRIPLDVWSYIEPVCIDWANSKIDMQDMTYWSVCVELLGKEAFATNSEPLRKERRTKVAQVAKVISERWQDGLPDDWTNKQVCEHVGKELKERKTLRVSDDTILRAAKRK